MWPKLGNREVNVGKSIPYFLQGGRLTFLETGLGLSRFLVGVRGIFF